MKVKDVYIHRYGYDEFYASKGYRTKKLGPFTLTQIMEFISILDPENKDALKKAEDLFFVNPKVKYDSYLRNECLWALVRAKNLSKIDSSMPSKHLQLVGVWKALHRDVKKYCGVKNGTPQYRPITFESIEETIEKLILKDREHLKPKFAKFLAKLEAWFGIEIDTPEKNFIDKGTFRLYYEGRCIKFKNKVGGAWISIYEDHDKNHTRLLKAFFEEDFEKVKEIYGKCQAGLH